MISVPPGSTASGGLGETLKPSHFQGSLLGLLSQARGDGAQLVLWQSVLRGEKSHTAEHMLNFPSSVGQGADSYLLAV